MTKYYGGHDGMLLQLASMSFVGCSVIVAGRAVTDDEGSSIFKTFEDVEVPEVLRKLVRLDLPEQIKFVLPHVCDTASQASHLTVCVLPSGCAITCVGADSGIVFIHIRRDVPQ